MHYEVFDKHIEENGCECSEVFLIGFINVYVDIFFKCNIDRVPLVDECRSFSSPTPSFLKISSFLLAAHFLIFSEIKAVFFLKFEKFWRK